MILEPLRYEKQQPEQKEHLFEPPSHRRRIRRVESNTCNATCFGIEEATQQLD